jgi:hypothetical protein
MGAHVLRTVALTGSDQAVRATEAIYAGFTIRETSGSAAAVVVIYDNASAASGTIIEQIGLAQGESAREYYLNGIWCVNGIYVDVVSGAVAGSIRYA